MPNKHLEDSKNFFFYIKDTKRIVIGRDKRADIKLDYDKSFSKVQATLNYDDKVKRWVFKDGGEKGPSRNGSWLFAAHGYELKDDLIIRVSNKKLLINVSNNRL